MATEISVNLAIVDARPPLRALADVTIRWPENSLTIRRCAVFKKDGQPSWASLPRLPIEKNGKKIYAPLIEVSRDLKLRVLEAVLAEYQKVKNEH